MRPGFISGIVVGVAITGIGLLLTDPSGVEVQATATWLQLNLGHSLWLFVAVVLVFAWQLQQLRQLLAQASAPDPARVSRLDQLLDVWIQSFIGIGVIWTAIGMRSALQSALSDPGEALTDTAGNVLRDLVDGGILLALTTTIVGAVGGYLMRLLKTALTGAQLQAFYAATDQSEVAALRQATERIEAHLRMNGGELASADQPQRPELVRDV